MSASHRPVRKTRRPAHPAAAQPAAQPRTAADAETHTLPSVRPDSAPVAAPHAVPEATSSPAAAPTEPAGNVSLVDGHLQRISGLIAKAEGLAEAMLEQLHSKLRRGQPVYPAELQQILRGLHILAKCAVELGRCERGGRKVVGAARGRSSADAAPE